MFHTQTLLLCLYILQSNTELVTNQREALKYDY